MSRNSHTFWERLFRQDIVRQANIVEVVGWVGLFAFAVSLYFFWTAKVTLMVFAQPETYIDEQTLEASVTGDYSPQTLLGRTVSIQSVHEEGEWTILGDVQKARYLRKGEALAVQVRCHEQVDLATVERMRISLDDRPLRTLFVRRSWMEEIF